MKIRELRGNSHTFTQTDGETFRIFARETKEIGDELISEDMIRAKDMKLLAFSKSPKTEVASTQSASKPKLAPKKETTNTEPTDEGGNN